nr:hypothetical protein [Rhodococcus sp. BS-15]
MTGSLAEAVRRVGAGTYGDDVSLRFTTKFDDVTELVTLDHGRKTRVRLSVNADGIAHRPPRSSPIDSRRPARMSC